MAFVEERVDIPRSPENRDIYTLSYCTVRSIQLPVLFNHCFYKLLSVCFCFKLNPSLLEKRTALYSECKILTIHDHDIKGQGLSINY